MIAVVGNSSVGTEIAYAPYLAQSNVPMVGGDDYDSIWETNPDLFPTMATVSVKGYADDYRPSSQGPRGSPRPTAARWRVPAGRRPRRSPPPAWGSTT